MDRQRQAISFTHNITQLMSCVYGPHSGIENKAPGWCWNPNALDRMWSQDSWIQLISWGALWKIPLTLCGNYLYYDHYMVSKSSTLNLCSLIHLVMFFIVFCDTYIWYTKCYTKLFCNIQNVTCASCQHKWFFELNGSLAFYTLELEL